MLSPVYDWCVRLHQPYTGAKKTNDPRSDEARQSCRANRIRARTDRGRGDRQTLGYTARRRRARRSPMRRLPSPKSDVGRSHPPQPQSGGVPPV